MSEANEVQEVKEQGRRVRVYSVNARDILNTFFPQQAHDGLVNWPTISPLPTGYKVLGTQLNWQTNCLDVMVEHESFNLIPDGQMPPSATDMITVWRLYELIPFKFPSPDSVKS